MKNSASPYIMKSDFQSFEGSEKKRFTEFKENIGPFTLGTEQKQASVASAPTDDEVFQF